MSLRKKGATAAPAPWCSGGVGMGRGISAETSPAAAQGSAARGHRRLVEAGFLWGK